MQRKGVSRANSWRGYVVAIIIVMISLSTYAQAAVGWEGFSLGPSDVSRSTPPGVQVFMMSLTMDDDNIVAYPLSGQSGEAVVTGTIEMTVVPPNTQIEIEVEMDNEWDVECSPGSMNYVRPQTTASLDISVRVTVPPNELAYTQGVIMVTVTASSPTSPAKTVNAAVMVRVGLDHDLDVEWRTKSVKCFQNDSFEIKGKITNNGNGDDTVAFVIERPFPGVLYIIDYADAPMNETTEFSVTVEVPENASLGDHHLKIHCFALDIFLMRQISAKDIDLEVIEESNTGGGMTILGILGIISMLGVAFFILRREKFRRHAGSEGAPYYR